MLRVSWYVIGLLTFVPALACKRKATPTPAQELASDVQGKPDKVSEEPTGLPGYPLLCRWVQGPASDTLEASLNCFLGDTKGEPAQLSEKLSWDASVSENASIVQTLQSNQSLGLTVKSASRETLGSALQNMQLTVVFGGQKRKAVGRDVVKAESRKLRLAVSCKNLFSLLFVNDLASFTYIELNRFTGCEQIATVLQNTVVPDGKSRQLPDLHKTVQASCSNDRFQLSINQPGFQANSSQGPIDPAACEDLRGLVNNLGL